MSTKFYLSQDLRIIPSFRYIYSKLFCLDSYSFAPGHCLLGMLIISPILALLNSCSSPLNPSTSDPNKNAPLTPTSIPNSIYYVDGQNGADANRGSQVEPWQTIQKAANTAKPGDTIKVLPGYYTERVIVSRPRITFDGEHVTMQGFTISADQITVRGFYITDVPGLDEEGYGFSISGSNCVIENNHVYFATSGGISLSNTTSNCIVKDNKFERNSQLGIEVQGKNHIIDGNEIWGSIQYHPKWKNPPTWVDADGIRFFGSGHVFRNNFIHDIQYGIPENVNPHIDCFQTWSDKYHVAGSDSVIEQNRCENIQAQASQELGTGLMLRDSKGGLVIRNNILNAYGGIMAFHSNNLTITNNTFIGKVPPIKGLGEYGVFLSDSTNVLIQNNIFYNIVGTTCNVFGAVSSGNLFYLTPEAGYLRCSPVAEDLWEVDPLFVNPSAGDYRLQGGSPAIEAGVGGATFGAAEQLPTP
jgi:parallel beta-helix repeat protein